eukprot:Hpha_TRINITY_DN12997_c0_g1::TRINITY_DN12997_c0_g1_i1::g.164258::m.164258/K15121/SLC25A44; solute carrier family 25, member 44
MSGAGLEWNQLDKRRVYTLIPLGSLAIRVPVYPAVVVKTRMQAGLMEEQGVRAALRAVRMAEGVRGLYKGFLVSLLSLPVGTLYFTVLERTKTAANGVFGKGNPLVGVV